MKLQLAAILVFAVLLTSITLANSAFAQKTSKNEITIIMENYRKTIQKAQSDFQAAVKKANSDARDAVSKGLPIDKINSDSKAAMQKARSDLKATVAKAQADAMTALQKLKATIDARASK